MYPDRSRDNHPENSLSAILITKNEAHQIRDCLSSLKFCDEIVLVDNASQDNTPQIARELGCQVIQTTDWPGYGIQKQRALNAARGRWVLSIDADERVTEELRTEILEAIETSSFDGYLIKRKSKFLGRWMRFGGWHPDHVLRLARREKCRFDQVIVHEKIIVDGLCGRLRNSLLHYSYESISDLLTKQMRYALLSATKIREIKRNRCSVVLSKIRSIWTFFRLYLLQLGFLDGREGFISAISKSQEVFWKYVAAEFEDQRK